jgi:hypothetical protein
MTHEGVHVSMTTPTSQRLALLRAAYPEGYLAQEGAKTLRGWRCSDPKPPAHFLMETMFLPPGACWLTRDTHTFTTSLQGWSPADMETGLLPDLTDPATWALALLDLANALEWKEPCNLTWRCAQKKDGLFTWAITSHPSDMTAILTRFLSACFTADDKGLKALQDVESCRGFDLGTDDPLDALLAARASLYEKEIPKGIPDVSTQTMSSKTSANGYDQKPKNEADRILLAILRGEREDHDESFLHVDLANLKARGITPTINPFCKFCGSYDVLGHGGACKPCVRKRHPTEIP